MLFLLRTVIESGNRLPITLLPSDFEPVGLQDKVTVPVAPKGNKDGIFWLYVFDFISNDGMPVYLIMPSTNGITFAYLHTFTSINTCRVNDVSHNLRAMPLNMT